ncbi:MAG: arsenate reductase ArsC [Rhodospirillales bacterium]|nr:MAG: arsenate reductase ArsC [Rhodospirillales bacterium]
MRSVLFLCVANSARSQMAGGLARRLLDDGVTVQSAGSRPATLQPLAVAVMAEIGIDISGHASKSVDEIDLSAIDTVVTLCAEEVCPVLPEKARRLHWPIDGPAKSVAGEAEARSLALFRAARDRILARVKDLARSI